MKAALSLRCARSLARSCEGATMLEFALIAPVFFMLIMGVIEFSLCMFTHSVMESASFAASRYGKTGYTASGGTSREDQIKAVILARAPYLDSSKITITELSYNTLADIGDPEPYTDTNGNGHYDVGEPYTDVNHNGHWDADQGATGAGQADTYVVYQISYPWQIYTPFVYKAFSSDGIVTITVRTVVKNEPYDT